ncbi:hypothetical protein VTO73DRAFT_7689 [Trametes versicolor]
MPALCSLHVAAEQPERSGLIPLNLSRALFPQLRRLDVSYMNVFGDLEIFSQLMNIKIKGCEGVNPELEATTIVEAVRRMQLVEELELDQVNVPDIPADTPGRSETDTIELHHLRNVVLSIDGPLIKTILNAVTIPATTTISCTSLFLSEYDEASSPDLQAVVPENQTGLPVLSQIVAATIATDEESHHLGGYAMLKDSLLPCGAGARVEFYIDIRSVAVLDIDVVPVGLNDLVYVFGDAPLEHLKVQTTAAIFERTDWPKILAAFPALRSIQLEVLHSDESDDEDYSTRACTQSFLRALKPANAGAAHDVDGGETPGSSMRGDAVPCSDLRHLEISGEQLNDGTALLNLLLCLSRRQRALGPDAHREGRLQRLVLRVDDLHDEADFLARRTTFLKVLSPLVDEVIYEEDPDSEDSD